jgi:photosystem II stability/assembly factor-like uncharacterized protein
MPTLVEQASHTTALLQAVSAVDDSVVWVSGHRATWARTTDGGATWLPGTMTGADSVLQFRDVHAVSASAAYLLAAGNGDRSQIYKTADAGRTWQLQWVNRDTSAFYDCFAFWDADHGVAVSDAVNGRLIVIRTEDGGTHWDRMPDRALPPALAGEGAFAASGTCLVAHGRSLAWIGTGAPTGARVYRTADRGRHWSVAETPVISGRATGIATVAFRDERHGIVLGGRLADPNDRTDSVVAVTDDGGGTWRLVARPTFSGSVYGSAYVPGLLPAVVAAGPKGLDWTPNEGLNWESMSTDAYWAVGFSPRGAGWAVGPGGRITRITFGPILAN